MGKDSVDRADFCPDCVNGNENEDTAAPVNQYDEGDCCSCCCCSCSSVESGVEEEPLSPVNPNEAPATGRALIQKKDLLSNLSIVRTNREQASIQNILQFVEALSHSNNFLRRYYMEEDFCLQCIQDSLCECNLRGIANLNLNDSCTCSGCEGNKSDVSEETGTINHSCTDCPASKKSARDRSHIRRNRRRRRRPRNSETAMQRRGPRENPRQHQNAMPEDYDSDCSECRRSNNTETPSNKILDRERCNCEECIRQAESQCAVNLNFNPDCLNSSANGKNKTQCTCDSRVVSNPEICSVPNCKDCRMMSSGEFDCNENSCNSDCAECRIPQSGEAPCQCCMPSERKSENQIGVRSSEKSNSAHESAYNSDQRGGASDCNSCDCEECQYATDCSDESCEECAHQKPGNKNSKKN
ncbi:hypothetical protein HNY73_005920 [Argiope bruennichi]|uniref:Uncharacterized protein n=1 Tax=Argiope bruennichi TaxID=94029 RepID=A0A8T0FKJ5_ARGBR|nr:hypothetical protein HNY73_005920 [Argiope bruennichi]